MELIPISSFSLSLLPGAGHEQLFWSGLKIQSPPPLEVVLRHLKIITDRHSQLDRWRYPETPVKVRRQDETRKTKKDSRNKLEAHTAVCAPKAHRGVRFLACRSWVFSVG